jgi:hypothetical protein
VTWDSFSQQATVKVLARPAVSQKIQPFNKEFLWVYASKTTYAGFSKTEVHFFCEV